MDFKNIFKTKKQKAEEARIAAEAIALAEAEKKRIAEEKKAAKEEAKKTPKSIATQAGEPFVEVLGIDIDPNDPGAGSFDLDWNDIFVARLVKAGYQGKTDQDIVDNWFRAVCRNVVLETYEQEQADPTNRTNRRDLGNGRTEVS